MTKQIYIHAGPGKTGTSALQKYFLENRKQLLLQGLFYPEHGIDQSGISSGNFWSIYEQNKQGEAELSSQRLNLLMAEFEKSPAHSLLLSSEAFFMRIPEIARFIPEAHFICYLRNPIDNLESVYNQSVKRHGNSKTFANSFPRPNFAILRQLELYLRHLPTQRFILRYYHPACFFEGNILSDLLKAIDQSAPAHASPAHINPSFSLEALELKRRLNALSLSPLAIHKLDKILQEFKGTQEFSLLTPGAYADYREQALDKLQQFFSRHPFSGSDCLIRGIEGEQQKPYYPQGANAFETEEILLFIQAQDAGLLQYLLKKLNKVMALDNKFAGNGLKAKVELWKFRLKSAIFSLLPRKQA